MTDFQLPDWMLDSRMSMKDRNKILRHCDRTALCIPNGTQASLTENQVRKTLKIRRAIVFHDEQTGRYWIRSSKDESEKFFELLDERGLPGFTTRRVERKDPDWERLAEKIADSMGLRNGGGPSQPQTSVEQQPGDPSTSHQPQVQVAENLGSGNEENSNSSLGLAGSRYPSESESSRATSPSIPSGGSSSTHASEEPVPDESRPRKRRRRGREVSQQALFSSPATSSTHEQPPTPFNIVGVSSLTTNPPHEQLPPPLNVVSVPSPTTNPPLLNVVSDPSPTTNPPPLDVVGVPSPATNLPPLNVVGVPSLTTNPPPLNVVGVPSPTTNPPPLNVVGVPPPTTNPPHAWLSPPVLDIVFRKLAPELIVHIFELCVQEATSSAEYNAILEKLGSHGGRCRRVLEENAAFWTRITSTSSDVHIKSALKFSMRSPLRIEGYPSSSKKLRPNVERFNRFFCLINPHRDRWASFGLLLPTFMMKKVKKVLARPAPSLQTLSLFMKDMASETEDASQLGAAAPMEEIHHSLDILGGEAGTLQRAFLNNVPCLWDPSPFTEIRELGLTNRIQLRYMETITFLRRSPNLSALRLVNVRFVGDAPHVVEETVVLPSLKELVFAELIERVGLGLLWLSLETPACSKLDLNLRPSEAFATHTALPSRAVPTVRKAVTSNSKSLLLFRCNIDTNRQSATWRSQDEDGLGQSEPQASFDISFRGLGNGLARFLCDFVRGVQATVGDVGGIVVSVADSFSGAIDPPLGVELDDLVPTLFPDSFRGLNVVEVRADIADKYLQLLLEMMAPPEPQVWWLDGLRTIRLYAIPEDKLALEPHATVQRSLGDFIQRVSKQHYGMVLGLDDPKPSGRCSLSVVLEGEFHIPTTMGQTLDRGKKWWGVTIDDTDAFLNHGEV